MLTEIIRELTEGEENMITPSQCVLTWTKRVEVNRAQETVINSLHELKNFDALLNGQRHKERDKIQPHW